MLTHTANFDGGKGRSEYSQSESCVATALVAMKVEVRARSVIDNATVAVVRRRDFDL